MNGTPKGTSAIAEAPEEPDESRRARREQRDDVDRAARRRQLQRERQEQLAEPQRHVLPPGKPGELIFVDAASEEPVRVARVVR